MVTKIGDIYNDKFMHVSRVMSDKTGDKAFVTFGRNKTNTGAIIVPVTKEGKILLTKEYRVAADTFVVGVPKGAADTVNEPSASIVDRELCEEIGATYSRIEETKLTVYPLPAFADFSGHVVFAYDVEICSDASLEEGEVIELYGTFTCTEVLKLLKDGVINDAESAMALQAYLLDKVL
ncbi:NUDIX hydrolase [Vibrio sp. D431a]|uniref:NUDIX hydrolase n=1 Tax=Vibrio sp. D431a TaxID=2837388 RepID=UPI0025525B5E|nr:NUDIX hydrolase [Vibrio sp. D431a]MDK9790176.1 NUDIX hydrolase [Vibrio sp. D431a]